MEKLTALKRIETRDEQAHRELEAIAGTLRVCGIKWKFAYNKSSDNFTAVLL